MPFTISHAIVALPFARRRPGIIAVPFGAVAIGAMAPDLPLFLPIVPYSTTHDRIGMFAVALPLALVLFAVWRVVLRPAAAEFAPRALAARLPAHWSDGPIAGVRSLAPGRGAQRMLTAVIAVLAACGGVLSHVVWDLFTHPGRLGSEWIPALAEFWGPLPATTWLQYGSSLVGLLALAVAAVVWWRGAVPHPLDRIVVGAIRAAFWWCVPAALAVGAVLAAATVPWPLPDAYAVELFVSRTGTRGGALLLVLTTVIAIIVDVGLERRRMRASPPPARARSDLPTD